MILAPDNICSSSSLIFDCLHLIVRHQPSILSPIPFRPLQLPNYETIKLPNYPALPSPIGAIRTISVIREKNLH